MDFIECLCLSARPSTTKPSPPSTTEQQMQQFYDLGMCRFLVCFLYFSKHFLKLFFKGQLLVDRFAGDGLTSHFCWHSWEQERELVSQLVYLQLILKRSTLYLPFIFPNGSVTFAGRYLQTLQLDLWLFHNANANFANWVRTHVKPINCRQNV